MSRCLPASAQGQLVANSDSGGLCSMFPGLGESQRMKEAQLEVREVRGLRWSKGD